jgi:hypothetical protein
MLRTPYLAGENDFDQLNTIFRALGTPTEQDWPVGSSRVSYTFVIRKKNACVLLIISLISLSDFFYIGSQTIGRLCRVSQAVQTATRATV